jgi:hypothetical protein
MSKNAKKVHEFACNTANQNMRIRLGLEEGHAYNKSKSFWRLIKYFIYPKLQDIQKPALIVLGAIYGVFYFGVGLNEKIIGRILLALFVFDFLAYQARYQINDIRGIEEDREAGSKNRLISDDIQKESEWRVIKLSSQIALFKIIVAFVIAVLFGYEERVLLVVCIVLLLIITVAYEAARYKNATKYIFLTVGLGYPLRVFLGFMAVSPENWKVAFNVNILGIMFSLWTYGIYSSILPWADSVARRMQHNMEMYGKFPDKYEKKHFMDIQEIIKDRFKMAQNNKIMGRVLPLRESGNYEDVWNRAYILSIIIITALEVCNVNNIEIGTAIIVASIFFVKAIKRSYIDKALEFIYGWVVLAGVLSVIICSNMEKIAIIPLIIVQILETVTYFVLIYQIQFEEFDFGEFIMRMKSKMFKTVCGRYAGKLYDENQSKDK